MCEASSSGMMLRVGGLERRSVEMGVDLRGGEVGMSKHLLHGAQVRAPLEKVGGEGVPQQMRM